MKQMEKRDLELVAGAGVVIFDDIFIEGDFDDDSIIFITKKPGTSLGGVIVIGDGTPKVSDEYEVSPAA